MAQSTASKAFLEQILTIEQLEKLKLDIKAIKEEQEGEGEGKEQKENDEMNVCWVHKDQILDVLEQFFTGGTLSKEQAQKVANALAQRAITTPTQHQESIPNPNASTPKPNPTATPTPTPSLPPHLQNKNNDDKGADMKSEEGEINLTPYPPLPPSPPPPPPPSAYPQPVHNPLNYIRRQGPGYGYGYNQGIGYGYENGLQPYNYQGPIYSYEQPQPMGSIQGYDYGFSSYGCPQVVSPAPSNSGHYPYLVPCSAPTPIPGVPSNHESVDLSDVLFKKERDKKVDSLSGRVVKKQIGRVRNRLLSQGFQAEQMCDLRIMRGLTAYECESAAIISQALEAHIRRAKHLQRQYDQCSRLRHRRGFIERHLLKQREYSFQEENQLEQLQQTELQNDDMEIDKAEEKDKKSEIQDKNQD